jgi:flagellar biosynthesis component FlhA
LRHPSEILGLPQTQRLLDDLGREHGALIRAMMPKPVSLALLCDVLRRLLSEGVTLRPLAHILEALGAEAARASSAAKLTAHVRVRLARHLTHALAPSGTLLAHRLDPMIEDALRDALAAGSDDEPALPPSQARDVVEAARRVVKPGAVILCQSDVRRALRALIEDELPEVAVLAYEELATDVTVDQGAPLQLA